MSLTHDIAIIGGGMVGLTTALACAEANTQIAVIDARPLDPVQPGLEKSSPKPSNQSDARASAIAGGSWNLLKNLGLGDDLRPHAQPIHDILISDGVAGEPLSPLSLHFSGRSREDVSSKTQSAAKSTTPMGMMIENDRLSALMRARVNAHPRIDVIAPARVTDIHTTVEAATVSLDGRDDVTASLLVAADGRNSLCRQRAGIDIQTLHYKQKALVTTIAHTKPHQGVAHEIFMPGGPFAILPLSENRANIVWSDKPAAIDAAMALPDNMFLSELARRFGDFLGPLTLAGSRAAYPLSLQLADHYTSQRLALVGDAAHAIHPIAGQGLNMGLRDAAALADIVKSAKALGQDIGGPVLVDYAIWRRFDNHALAAATDVLNRLFSNAFPPLMHLRRLGLGAVDNIGPLKSFFINEASGLGGELPALMRG